MIETVVMKDRVREPFWTKLNPLWWLVGPDGWTVPDINNGAPYLPDVQNIWLRRFYWFVCRNPLMNFVGYVLGVEDANYSVTGTAPVLLTTWRDASPPATGWKCAVLFPPFSIAALVVALGAGAGAWFLHWALWIVAAWSALKVAGPLPFVSYNGAAEFYTGWRPASGGFGSKLVFHKGS